MSLKNLPVSRRNFLASGSLTAAAIASNRFPALSEGSANQRIRIGVMGLHRGQAHLSGFLHDPDAEIAYVCDVDRRAIDAAAQSVEKRSGRRPQGVTDFRRILDDRNVDAISIAAPNH